MANFKKTTRHHAHLSLGANQGKLMMQSRENGQKPQFGQCFDDFEIKYLQIANFSEKRSHPNWWSYLVLTSGHKPKKLLEPFLGKISKCLILC